MLAVEGLSERYGGAKKSRGIWYHGTRKENLKSILSNGLVPDPKQRNWDKAADDQSSMTQASLASYGGIYVTKNLVTAMSSVREGGRVPKIVVCMELQPRSLVADEDTLNGLLTHIRVNNVSMNSWMIGNIYFSRFYAEQTEKNRELWNRAFDAYQKNLVEMLSYNGWLEKREGPLYDRLMALLPDMFDAALRRAMSHYPENEGDGWGLKLVDLHNRWVSKDREIESSAEAKKLIPEVGQAEEEYRQQADKWTKALKSLVQKNSLAGHFNTVGRSLEPIGFSGRNKIVCVAEIIYTGPNEGGSHQAVRLHYGELPEDFKSQYKQRIGTLVMAGTPEAKPVGQQVAKSRQLQAVPEFNPLTGKPLEENRIMIQTSYGFKLLTRSTRNPGMFQVTDFDKKWTPTGHHEYKTVVDALEDIWQDIKHPVFQEGAKLVQGDAWARAFSVVEKEEVEGLEYVYGTTYRPLAGVQVDGVAVNVMDGRWGVLFRREPLDLETQARLNLGPCVPESIRAALAEYAEGFDYDPVEEAVSREGGEVELDPKFFDDQGSLRPEIRDVLMVVATTVMNKLTEKGYGFSPVFVRLTGSLCGAGWDDQSDIDLHIGYDKRMTMHDPQILRDFLSLWAKDFNSQGYTVGGRVLELYFQEVSEPHDSPGEYDLVYDHWWVLPTGVKIEVTEQMKQAAEQIKQEAELLTKAKTDGAEPQALLIQVEAYWRQVTQMRKSAMLSGGMASFGNQVFKLARRNGALQLLKDLMQELQQAVFDQAVK
ncbi:MAG: hypothetical protein WCZ10_15160 [Desulfobulbaceae bacterium]